jgi:hypothetical protein
MKSIFLEQTMIKDDEWRIDVFYGAMEAWRKTNYEAR